MDHLPSFPHCKTTYSITTRATDIETLLLLFRFLILLVFVSVCCGACMYLVLYTRIALCIHHHSQDTDCFHHQRSLLLPFYSYTHFPVGENTSTLICPLFLKCCHFKMLYE